MIQIKEKRVSQLRVGLTENGFLVRVEGRGTVKLSPLLHQFAVQSFESRPDEPRTTVIVDLSACEYLDSTFLGCLLTLNRQYNRGGDPRIIITATREKIRELLEPSNLHRVLDIREVSPEPVSDLVELNHPPLLNTDLGRHVLDCHRRLAELDGPNREEYRSIVDRLDGELSTALMVRGL